MKKRILSFALALVLAVSLLPVSVFAAENHDGQVHVTVENTTWTKADGAPWEGILVDTWVDLKEDSTMMSCVTAALDAGGYSYSGADQGYISEINGISQMDASGESGWMGTLNDWFTDKGFANFTVANGKLAAGDEIRVMHTKNGYGKDIGSDWSTVSDTSLSALSFSAGTLSPAFSKDVTSYTLTLTEPADVKVSATATNKSNQVYLSVGETEYRRTAAIPADGGTVLTVRCGDTGATTYTVTVKMDVPQAPPARRDGVPAEATAGVSVNKPYTLDLSTIFTDINGDALTYLVSVNGGAFQTADKDYTYTPTEEGTTTLTFKANDGTADSTDTYTVTLTAYDKVDVKFKGLSSSKLKSFRVYTYENEQIGKENLLENVSIASNTYTVRLPAGDYWVEGYDATGNCCGGIKVTVQPGAKNEFNIHVFYNIEVVNSYTDEDNNRVYWKEGEDYTVDLVVKDSDGTECAAAMGEFYYNSAKRRSCIVLHKGLIEFTFIPTEKWANEGYVPTVGASSGKTALADFSMSQTTIMMGSSITVRAPLGATVSAGYVKQSYYYWFAKSTVTETESEEVATFVGIPEDAPVFVRVQHPDGVTYWNFSDLRNDLPDQGLKGKMNDAGEIVITAEDLAIGDSSFNKNTIYRFEKNTVDRGDIYLNINKQSYKSMSVGETFDLNVFRNWQAIEGFGNAYIALPDMHYQVVDPDGNPSDVVSVEPNANNSSTAVLTANKAGTALVMITYDAMFHPQGAGSKEGNSAGAFTAIWPECTGVFVVTVDEDGTGIQTNMTVDRMDAQLEDAAGKEIDSEHDILFYLGDEGAEYSFKPEDGCTVTVARSTVDEKMSFNGFTSDGVSVAADGTVTVSGLTTGRHIIRVEKGGVANYQVITARQATLKLLDKDGNELPMDTEFQPGDVITLQFGGLMSPQEKLATAYNFNFKLHCVGSDGTYFDSDPGGDYGVYNFSSSPELQRVTITIPEDWTGAVYQVSGAMSKGGFAGAATHRVIAYGTGRKPVFDAAPASGILARLPEVTLRVQNTKLEDIYQTTGDYISGLGTPDVGSIGGEWMALGLARSGRTVPAGYYDAVVEYVKANADANERLHRSKSTDNSRIILALTALGKDVTNVGGHNLLKGLDSMDYIQTQGINGPIWALIALDSHNYPTSGDVTREKLIQVILDAQLPGGGWNLSGNDADPDMTAMAIQALAPYYKENDAVKAAVDKALDVLSELQLATGGFGSWGTENSESCAQVIVAMTALGIDPATDSRFVKNGLTILDALAGYYVDGGGFKHTADGELDGMATEQGYYALAAYYRFVNGQTSLYDMSDVTIQKEQPAKPGTTPSTGDNGVLLWVITMPVAALAAALVIGKKKREA